MKEAGKVERFDGRRNQAVLSYGANDIDLLVDGSSTVTDTSATIPSGLTSLHIGYTPLAAAQPNGLIHRVRTYAQKRVIP